MLKVESLETELIGPVTFAIEPGECVGLVGPSGAGKSLLLRAIADLDPNRGRVSLGDWSREAMPASAWRKTVALIPAESGWWADLVRDHFPSAGNVARWLDAVGLPDALDWHVARLSTGERQRLAIARALAHEPCALLLDEPTASLDEAATMRIEALLRDYCAQNKPVLIVSHDERQIRRMASRRMVVAGGKIERIEQIRSPSA
ncbi:MAG: ABC transporter ATP-binding protein [Hyphomicrobiaceae bacterium]|nr:ABC transporter ATP-binding protein [Hyphomicrobiaceae bacterium]